MRRFLIFQLAEHSFAIPVETVREILPLPDLHRSPAIPGIVEGFLNLEGNAIPVLNPRRLFRLTDSAYGLYSHLLLFKNASIGLLADRVSHTIEVPKEKIAPVSETQSFNGCVEGEFLFQSGTVGVLSIDKLLLKEEQARVAELRAMEERRLLELISRS